METPTSYPAAAPQVVRIGDLGELAAGLPHLLGFRPEESLVLVALGGASGRRIGMTARVDIPAASDTRAVAGLLADRLATAAPRLALLVVVSEVPDDPGPELPHLPLVHEVLLALTEREMVLGEAVLVRGGRWWSYDCADDCCRPGAGRPLPAGTGALAAASVLAGQVVAADRGALAARLEGPPDAARRTAEVCERVGLDMARERFAGPVGDGPAAPDPWAVITAAAACCAPGSARALSDEQVARVVWELRDLRVRDRAMGLALGPVAAGAEVLWTECTRRAPAPLDAAPATLLATCAWARGDGAMASIAFERALRSDPGYRLAALLSHALAAGVSPRELRALITGTLEDLGAADDLPAPGAGPGPADGGPVPPDHGADPGDGGPDPLEGGAAAVAAEGDPGPAGRA